MVHTIVDGTFRQTNLTNESSEYLAKREELRLAEIELMRQRERVAELRRNLTDEAQIHFPFSCGSPFHGHLFGQSDTISPWLRSDSLQLWIIPSSSNLETKRLLRQLLT
jgi:hypothetical protein